MEEDRVLSPGFNGPGDFGHGTLELWFPEVKSIEGPLGSVPFKKAWPPQKHLTPDLMPQRRQHWTVRSNSTPDSVLATHRVPSRNQESQSPPAINTCRLHQSWSLKKENATQRMGVWHHYQQLNVLSQHKQVKMVIPLTEDQLLLFYKDQGHPNG